jgi:LPS-assembly protein
MKLIRCVTLLLVLSVWSLCSAAEQDSVLRIRAQGENAELIDGETTTVLSHTNGVELTYQDVVLTATRISVNKQTSNVLAEGTVRLQRGSNYWTSEVLEYNFATKDISAQQYRTGVPPLYVSGFGLSTYSNRTVYTSTNAFITTDDNSHPGYRIKAKEVIIKPGEYVEAKGATFYVGDVPVFYLPHYRRDVQHPPQWFSVVPGASSRFGPYILGQYNFRIVDQVMGTLDLDYRVKRGIGGGPGVKYDLGDWGKGDVQAYYTYDNRPGNDSNGKPIDPERYRVWFSYQTTLRTNFTVKSAIREESDMYMSRDFFESQYRRDPQPDSYLELNQLWPNFSFNALARPQVNDFFETVERLPDLKFTGLRQQIGQSPLYYESESSAAYLRYRSPAVNSDYEAFRADSFHQVTMPETLFGWMNVIPRVGGRYTYYTEADGKGSTTEEQDRWVFNTGMEVTAKASRTWKGLRNNFWEMDGLRHIVQPSFNYVFVPEPSAVPHQLPQFDQEFASMRLLPIEYPDYNSIDSIDSQNVMRLMLRNKLQTKRGGNIVDFANWAVYTDWRLNPTNEQTSFTDIFSDLVMQPRSWLSLISQTRYSVDAGRFNLADHYFLFEPSPVWSYGIGHRYMTDSNIGFGPDAGHNLILSRLYLKLNENYGMRVSHLFEARDGTLEEQYYSLYRDFRSWTGALTFRVRNERTGSNDYTIAFTVSLKAFPRLALGEDKENPSLLLGR